MWRLLKNRRAQVGALLLAALVAVALWPRAEEVEVAEVTRGPLRVTVDEEGETRVRERYEVTAPVAGELLRIELEPGDRVEAGRTALATLRPAPPEPLDARARATAEAAVGSAAAALGRARAERDGAAATLTRAEQRLDRATGLAAEGVVSRDELDAHEAALREAREALRAADFGVARAERDLDVARARLLERGEAAGRDVVLVAPVDGVVLRRHRESQAVVAAGEPLLELGNPAQLEIVADLLSSDAVRVRPGQEVLIEQWGGSETLRGRVRRVEPGGFLKVSALGVEEQRVDVVIDLEDPARAFSALGDGYRVEVRIVAWQQDDVLKVPTGSLFRRGDAWALFVVERGRARLRTVTIGPQNGVEAQVVAGLAAEERIVLYPPDTLADGDRVRARGA